MVRRNWFVSPPRICTKAWWTASSTFSAWAENGPGNLPAPAAVPATMSHSGSALSCSLAGSTPELQAPLLEVQNLQVSPGRRVAVRLPALRVRSGDLLHLCGPNGAGKTTLLRALAGDQHYQGEIRLAGHRPGSVQARQHTAFVPTDPDLPDDLTAREWLEFLAAAWGQPVGPLLGNAQHVGLTDDLEDWPTSLSRGTRQKVALAAALGLSCALTLLDEPFGTLDAASREALRVAIGQRVAEGGAVIVVTHGDELEGLTPRRLNLSVQERVS